jgi:hypothetical protein
LASLKFDLVYSNFSIVGCAPRTGALVRDGQLIDNKNPGKTITKLAITGKSTEKKTLFFVAPLLLRTRYLPQSKISFPK